MNAIQEAVDLLLSRKRAAEAQRDELAAEIGRITSALVALGHAPGGEPAHEQPILAFAPTATTITGAVRELMEAEYGPWSPALAMQRLAGSSVRGDRDEATFKDAIRTAFHSLRTQKVARQVAPGQTVAVVQLPSRNAEAPAGTGAPEGERPSEDLSRKEGGTGHVPAPPRDRDHSGDAEVGHDHGYGASLVEAS